MPLRDIEPESEWTWAPGERRQGMNVIRRATRLLPAFVRAVRSGRAAREILQQPRFAAFDHVYLTDPIDLVGAGPPWRVAGGKHRLVAARECRLRVVPASLDPWPKGFRPPPRSSVGVRVPFVRTISASVRGRLPATLELRPSGGGRKVTPFGA